jgi:hypothetical protein
MQTPEVDEQYGVPPSKQAVEALQALRQAVDEALDRKRRLGQYAVVWLDGRAVDVQPDDLLDMRALSATGGSPSGRNLVELLAGWSPLEDGLPDNDDDPPQQRDGL